MESLKVIAHIKTDFSDKFGIPRQSGLVNTKGKIIFEPDYRDDSALRGLEDFSHLWLIWGFSANKTVGFSPTVRPPRLGGNKRMGVFATRSPNRPNPIGLSSVKIEEIYRDGNNGTVIIVSGADLLNNTPIYDIKPYLKFTDCHPEAKGGFADEVIEDKLTVEFLDGLQQKIDNDDLQNIIAILGSDPRPHYHVDERVYAFEFAKYHIEFSVKDDLLTVCSVSLAKDDLNV